MRVELCPLSHILIWVYFRFPGKGKREGIVAHDLWTSDGSVHWLVVGRLRPPTKHPPCFVYSCNGLQVRRLWVRVCSVHKQRKWCGHGKSSSSDTEEKVLQTDSWAAAFVLSTCYSGGILMLTSFCSVKDHLSLLGDKQSDGMMHPVGWIRNTQCSWSSCLFSEFWMEMDVAVTFFVLLALHPQKNQAYRVVQFRDVSWMSPWL